MDALTAFAFMLKFSEFIHIKPKSVQHQIVSYGSDSSSEYIHKACLQQTPQSQLLQVDVRYI